VKFNNSEAQMSDVNTQETNKQSGWTSAALLGGTLLGAIWALPVVLPAVFGHLILTGIAAAGATAYVASSEGRRDKAKSFFSRIGGAYKDAFANLSTGWGKATKWAEAKEAAAKAKASAPEATGGTSPLASKEAGTEFNAASNDDVKAKTKPAPTPVAKPTARLGM
jgi:hypothetical protein